MSRLKTKRISVATDDGGAPLSAAQALRSVRDDIKEIETHSVDGSLVLVPKADVLDILQEWIEYVLNPDE